MHSIKILGLVLVFVGFSSATLAKPISSVYKRGDELADGNDELSIVGKPVVIEHYPTSSKLFAQTDSPKKLDLESNVADGNSKVNQGGEADGGYSRVARAAGHAIDEELYHPGGGVQKAVSGTFKSPGIRRKDEDEEDHDNY